MGPRAGLDWCGKSRPPPGFDFWTAQPVASRCTDYATRPTKMHITIVKLFYIYTLNFISLNMATWVAENVGFKREFQCKYVHSLVSNI